MYNSILLLSFLALLTGVLAAPCASRAGIAAAGVLWLACCIGAVVAAVRHRAAETAVHAAAVLGSLWLGAALAASSSYEPVLPDHCPAVVRGVVREAVEWQPSAFSSHGRTQVFASFMLDVDTASFAGLQSTTVGERVRCTLVSDEPIPLQRADGLAVSGQWQRLAAPTNPGQFDAAAFFRCLGVYYRFTADTGELRWFTPAPLGPVARLQRALDRMRARAASLLDTPGRFDAEGVILRNMLLGTRDSLPDNLVESFQRTGTFHIIAISGMHIGIMYGLWWCMAWLAGVPGRWRGAAVLPVIWLYALMAGMSGSVVRSVLMFSALALAPLLSRPHRAINTLLVAAYVFVLIWPDQVFSLGTQLTFVSVAALLLIAPLFDAGLARMRWVRGPAVYDIEHRPWRWLHSVARYFLQIASGTLAVWLVTWPITLTRGNLVAPVSWLANLLVVPLASLVLASGFVTLLLTTVSTTAALWLHYSNLLLMHIMVRIMEMTAAIPSGYFAVRTLTAGHLFWYYLSLVLACAWAWMRGHAGAAQLWHTRLAGSATCVALAVFLSMCRTHDGGDAPWRIVALDVGLGDAIVLHVPSGETVLIDGGARLGPWSFGNRVVIPYLRASGIDTLDAVVCTHFDRDHAGGLADVLGTMRVRRVYAPPDPADRAAGASLRSLAAAQGAVWTDLHAGDQFCVGALTGLVFSPPSAIADWPATVAARNENAASLVIRFECRNRSFLATGDAPQWCETLQLARNARIASDVVKLAHHGSAGSNSERYFAAAAPALALLSVGPNSAGLPAPQVLQRIAAAGVPLVRTDMQGACMLTFKNDTIVVKEYTKGH